MNVRQNLSVLFYLKRKKATKDGKAPIYVRITIDGLRDEFAFGYKVLPGDWDEDAKKILSTDASSKSVNKKINQAQADIERHFDLMQVKHGIATPLLVKESYLTPLKGHDLHHQRVENLQLSESIDETILSYIRFCKKVKKADQQGRNVSIEKQVLLNKEKAALKDDIEKLAKKAMKIFDDKNRTKTLILSVDEFLLHFMQLAITGHRSPNTLEKWIGRKKRYQDFLKYRYKLQDIPLSQMEFKFLADLVKYLLVQHEVEENTAMKYAQCIKEIMDRTVANGWTTANIFSTFQCRYIESENDWPTMAEFEILINYQFEKDILNRVRDVAIFQAFTGFAYNETYSAEPVDIIIGIDGLEWISKNRQKTGFDESVPLLPIAKSIIEKYRNDPKCSRSGRLLPVPTNACYNKCLKEIAGILKTNVLNNTHQFRYFFANEVTFNKGVPLKTVSKMLGHRSIKTTEIYVRANKSNISENMQMVKEKLFDESGNLQSKPSLKKLYPIVSKPQLINLSS